MKKKNHHRVTKAQKIDNQVSRVLNRAFRIVAKVINIRRELSKPKPQYPHGCSPSDISIASAVGSEIIRANSGRVNVIKKPPLLT